MENLPVCTETPFPNLSLETFSCWPFSANFFLFQLSSARPHAGQPVYISSEGGHRGVKALDCVRTGGTVPLQKYWNVLRAGQSTVSVDTPTASGGSPPKIYWYYKHPQDKHDFRSVDNSISTEICICRSPSLFL